ncbi:MAG: N-acetylmuramoyl-L-alanine amidase [Planctomycetes bacterium]|nr:N-acetylmuramoyl-L-alanine amidase [Planctomycetota bacterium]
MGESKNLVKSDGRGNCFGLSVSQIMILVLVGMVALSQWGCTPEYRPVNITMDPTYGSVGQSNVEALEYKPAPPIRVPPSSNNGALPRLSGATIVVDAGHGGRDPGAPGLGGGNLPEKQIVLMIALQLASELSGAGANVIMTRRGDSYVSLDQRVEISNRNRADLFVSVHADAAGNRGASGATIFIARQASSRALGMALSIHRALKAAGVESRGVRREDFRVLKDSRCSAVLVESGFVTNSMEARKLNTASYRNRVARAIARGIADYLK